MKKTAFLFIAILLPFLLVNEALRWILLRNNSFHQLLRRDWSLIFSLPPNFSGRFPFNMDSMPPWNGKGMLWEISTNPQGLRGQKPTGPKAPGVLRIICLGDSITFGQDVSDHYTYPYQLEKILANSAAGEERFEVINAGVPAYTSRQGLACLDQRLLKYKPDLVILGFGFNDAQSKFAAGFRPDKAFIKGEVKTGWSKIYRSPVNVSILIVTRQPLFSSIRTVSSVMKVVLAARLGARLKESKVKLNFKPRELTEKDFKDSRVAPADFRDNLNQFVWLAQKNGFKLLFYVTSVTHPLYRSIILDIAQKQGIPVVDFSGKLERYKLDDLLKNELYADLIIDYRQKLGDDFLRDNPIYVTTSDAIHPNPAGNRIVAEAIAGTIISQTVYKPYFIPP